MPLLAFGTTAVTLEKFKYLNDVHKVTLSKLTATRRGEA